MRIFYQNLIAVISVLLLLVVITAAVSYRLERAEMLRGIEEGASSLAIALSKFVEEEVANSRGSGGVAELISCDRLNRAVDMIKKHNPSAALIALYSPEGRRVLYSSGDSYYMTIPAQTLPTVQPGKTVSVRGGAVVSCAGVLGTNKELAAVVQVITRPADLSAFLDRMRRRSVLLGLLALLLGLGVAYFSSALLAREINTLRLSPENSVQPVQGRRGDRQWYRIREIEDLRNTLNTIESVMQETVTRGRRSFAGRERFLAVRELCSEMGVKLRQPRDLRVGKVCLCLRPVGAPPEGEFLISGKNGQDLYAFAGRVSEGERGDAVLRASAARTVLEDLLSRYDPAAAHKRLSDLFQMESMICVLCQTDTRTVRVFSGRSGAFPPREEIFSLKGGRALVVHDLEASEDLSPLVEGIVSVYDGLSCCELADKLAYSLSHEGKGTVLVVGKA